MDGVRINMDYHGRWQPEIASFLITFGAECRNNIEFSEWSNELLFAVLDRQTELALKTMEKEQNNIDLGSILNDLGEPMHDHIKLDNLITKVEKIRINRRLKNRIVARLRSALSSSN